MVTYLTENKLISLTFCVEIVMAICKCLGFTVSRLARLFAELVVYTFWF